MSVLSRDTSKNKMYDWRVKGIYQILKQNGKEHGPLEISDLMKLGHLDQYHYLGVNACDKGIRILGLEKNAQVLDIGSGVGGPARYISYRTGCEVTGIELQECLNETAIELTQRVGLADKVSFITGDILEVDIKENYFDHFVSWLVFFHIPDRSKLFSVCFKALKPGGTFLIEDMVALHPFSDEENSLLRKVVLAPYIPNCETYRIDLEKTGFVNLKFEDLSDSWKDWVNFRYQLHNQNKEELLKLYDEAVFKSQASFYHKVAQLFNGGNLGGMCITGKKPS